MDKSRMPFVAVIGGFWQLDETTRASAKAAGRDLGAELAKAGFGLVVYYSNEESLEPHVVAGYLDALADQGGEIRVRYAESQRGQIRFEGENARPELFDYRLFPGLDWEAPFYRSLAEEEGVNAVLLVGGATSTLIAGQIAIARRLPVLAVDAFGGAATKIWNQISQASPEKHSFSWGTRSPAAFVAQLKNECSASVARKEEALRVQELFAKITSRRQQVLHAAAALIVLLITLLFGMVYTPSPAIYPIILFGGLISAGAMGALVRGVLLGQGDNDSWTSFLLGGVAGFVVGLAYLIPQWVGAPGVLVPNAETVLATDKIQFVSAVLVAVSAGVGFDTVFNRLQKQAEDSPISPSR